jgi:hypothetical protein
VPAFSVPTFVFLGLLLATFGAFVVTLIAVHLYTLGAPQAGPVAHEVIQAKRAEGVAE